MMRESTERKVQAEEQKRGLVIVEAWYGRFVSPSRFVNNIESLHHSNLYNKGL